jgi:hypothetical protein
VHINVKYQKVDYVVVLFNLAGGDFIESSIFDVGL